MKVPVTYYKCGICGNIAELIKDGGGKLVCCNSPMTELKANTTEASFEKHIPVASRENGKITVQVGSNLHPMTQMHYIEWIAIAGDEGYERVMLAPDDEPKAVFCDKKNAKVYAYCNLHGLWESEIK